MTKNESSTKSYKVAVKSVSLGRVPHKKFIYKELAILREIDHPFVIRFIEFIEEGYLFHFVTELVKGVNLRQFVSTKGKLSEAEAASVISRILKALSYLHGHRIAHRDIKPENIMVSEDLSELRVIDFGLSRHFSSKEKMKGRVGTPVCMAPEVISDSYSSKCDVWSLGVVGCFLLTGRFPFESEDLDDLFSEITKEGFDLGKLENISASGKDFLTKLLHPKPSKRVSASEALTHPWLASPSLTIDPGIIGSVFNPSTQNKFIRETLKIATNAIPTKELKSLIKAFTTLDQSNKGYFTFSDVKKYAKTHQIGLCKSTKLTGRVYFREFLIKNIQTFTQETYFKTAFELFDWDNDGYLSTQDLQYYFDSIDQTLTESELSHINCESAFRQGCSMNFYQFKNLVSNLMLTSKK